MDPRTAFLISFLLALVVLVFLWPRRGAYWRLRRLLQSNERVLAEDALKHVFDCEARGGRATVSSVAGSIGRSTNRAAEIVAMLERGELVVPDGDGYRLSPTGRRNALRVIRIHRLWERYLSDETGLAAEEWHHVAEEREHRTSPEQADALAARMGHPRFDPHGDPIPTAAGEVVPTGGTPLTRVPVGVAGEIVHIEDEPHAVYARLVDAGLHPGMIVRLIDATPERVRFEADGREHELPPVVAANLSIVALEADDVADLPPERMSSLAPGERGRVAGISSACRGPQRRRLLDLGLLPGTLIEAEMRSAAGDPTAYRVRGALVALRRDHAELIHIDRVTP